MSENCTYEGWIKYEIRWNGLRTKPKCIIDARVCGRELVQKAVFVYPEFVMNDQFWICAEFIYFIYTSAGERKSSLCLSLGFNWMSPRMPEVDPHFPFF